MTKSVNQLVTIAIPAFKGRFLAEAIKSALKQDYDNIELIVVNDHSPDNIRGIVDSFKDSRIRYYENERNLGKKSIVLNWNKCLEYARGDFFVLLCDDDLLVPTFVSRLLSLASEYPKCCVFHSRVRLLNAETGNEIGETPVWPEFEQFGDFARHTSNGERHHTISEFLLRTNAIRERGGYIPSPAGYYSDMSSILRFADAGGVCSFEECLVTYRKNDDCISSDRHYNYEKSLSALEYYDWLMKNYSEYCDPMRLKDLGDFELASYFMGATLPMSLKILRMVPGSIWPFKVKLRMMFKRLSVKVEGNH